MTTDPTPMPMSLLRMLALKDWPEEQPRIRRLAEIICTAAFGDWEATGYEIKLACVRAAEAAVLCLDQHGWDLTLLDADDH